MRGFACFIRCTADRQPPRGTAKVHLRSRTLLEFRGFALQQETGILRGFHS